MRRTSWSLFQTLARLMQISMEPVPVAVITPQHFHSRNADHRGRRLARARMLAQRRQSRLMPRSSLGRAGRVAVSQPS
jgi:hypothetical protein